MSRCRRRMVWHAFLFWFAVHPAKSFTVPPTLNHKRRRVQCCCRAKRATSDGDNSGDSTMSTALCVIPPDRAWDTIQRARHLARDRTYHLWPPAVRLFHPFCPRSRLSNVALEIARIVEEFDVEPFEVSLNTWTIVPHMEALEADWEAMRRLPEQEEETKETTGPVKQTEADRLIAEEERVGRIRLRKREMNSLQKRVAAQTGSDTTESHANLPREEEEDDSSNRKQSPRELLEKQKLMYEEFNGPCVLCLEPDEESKERLIQLRELLRAELFESYDKFSPSSSVSTTKTLPRSVVEMDETTSFRPVVPVGNFPTVTSAVEMARKLKGLWDPLSFNVTDFHLISYGSEAAASEEHGDFSDNQEYNLKKTSSFWKVEHEEATLTAQGQFGCDALVMLIGEEVDVDEEGSREVVDLIMSRGSPGGYDLMEQEASDDVSLPASLNSGKGGQDDDDTGNLELWLDSDDEWDEGTVVVIGRTHFFSGEMRTYGGMPASSTFDAKDRVLGEGVHASARRRGSAHRAANVWKEGEFGRRDSDFSS